MILFLNLCTNQKETTIFVKMKTTRILPVFVLLVAGLLLSSCSGAISSSSWPGLSADQNFAYIADAQRVFAVKLSDGTQAWSFPAKPSAGQSFYAAPQLTEDGQLIVGGFDKLLYSLNPQTGAPNSWTFSAGDRWVGAPLIDKNTIYAPNSDHKLYAVDSKGKKLWEFKTNNANWAQPVSDGQTLYLASMDHFLYAIDKTKGTLIWKTDCGSALMGAPVLSSQGILYVGTFGNELLAVDSKTGKVSWRFTAGGGVWSGPAETGTTVYFGDLIGNFYLVDTGTHKAISQTKPDGPIVAQPLVTKDKIIYVTENGTVTAVDTTGKVLWNKPINGKLYTTPVLAGDRILIATTQSEPLLVALDQSGNQVWTFTPPK